jgi:hypothetical protein
LVRGRLPLAARLALSVKDREGRVAGLIDGVSLRDPQRRASICAAGAVRPCESQIGGRPRQALGAAV